MQVLSCPILHLAIHPQAAQLTSKQIIIGGDSAGGHLALSLLSHLHRPRPKSPGIEYKIDAWHPLKGCFLVSPLASFDLSTHSFNRRFSADVLCKYTVGEWGKSLVANSPWDDEISLGLGWGMALDVPEEWWEGLDVGAHILVTGGEEEVFRDHIVQLVDVLRRRSTAGVTPYLARDEAHDGPLMNFMAGGMRGGSTGVITRWVVERFQE